MPPLLQVVAVGRDPVDVVAASGRAETRLTLENLGDRTLRFVPAAAAGEAAPADLRAGHLLHPGRRRTVSTMGAGLPLWAWGGGTIGVAPALGPAAAGLGGGGLQPLFAGQSVETTLDGAHNAGDTELTVDDASDLALDRVRVRGELHAIEAIDEAANRITIGAPGLAAAQANGVRVDQAPILGADDTLTLDGGPWAELDIRILWDLRRPTASADTYNGRSSGAYYSGDPAWAWFETLTNYSYWWANAQTDVAATWSVGLIHATAGVANAWSVEFDPATGQLSLLPVDDSLTVSFIPRAYRLIAAGRAA